MDQNFSDDEQRVHAAMAQQEIDALEYAIEVARQDIPTQKLVRRAEYRTGYSILQLPSGAHRVYSSDAWERPSERGLLPWQPPPSGTIVASVAIDGSVTMTEKEPACQP